MWILHEKRHQKTHRIISVIIVFALVLSWFYTPLPSLVREKLPAPLKKLAQAPVIPTVSASVDAFTATVSTSWLCPANVYSAYVACWGGGGGGGDTYFKGFNIAPAYYFSSKNGIGRINVGATDDSAPLRGFVRGASALYDLDLGVSPATATSTIGFRCAK